MPLSFNDAAVSDNYVLVQWSYYQSVNGRYSPSVAVVRARETARVKMVVSFMVFLCGTIETSYDTSWKKNWKDVKVKGLR